jgi:hypothetical protein
LINKKGLNMTIEERVAALEERVVLMQERLYGLLLEDNTKICPACVKGMIKDKVCSTCKGTGKKAQ